MKIPHEKVCAFFYLTARLSPFRDVYLQTQVITRLHINMNLTPMNSIGECLLSHTFNSNAYQSLLIERWKLNVFISMSLFISKVDQLVLS